jgi:hypothetical protein
VINCPYLFSIKFLDGARAARFGRVLLLTTAMAMAGCNSFGPDSLRGTHPLYNEGSMNEQFLQNVVRLRYREPVFFLDVASVTASLKMDMSASAGATKSTGPALTIPVH